MLEYCKQCRPKSDCSKEQSDLSLNCLPYFKQCLNALPESKVNQNFVHKFVPFIGYTVVIFLCVPMFYSMSGYLCIYNQRSQAQLTLKV